MKAWRGFRVTAVMKFELIPDCLQMQARNGQRARVAWVRHQERQGQLSVVRTMYTQAKMAA
jgi:hypothetical protein